MSRRTLALALAFAAIVVFAAEASGVQQVIEIDLSAGRDVINDDERSISIPHRWIAIDHERSVLFVMDREEPEGVMAFALNSGEWLRTYRAPRGGGPSELPGPIQGLASDHRGGLYLVGASKVLHLDSIGRYVGSWMPRVPAATTVCDLGGRPAVPAQGGVIRQGDDGIDEVIGGALEGANVTGRNLEDAIAAARWLAGSQLWCTADAAYLVAAFEDGADSLHVYDRDGGARKLDVPMDLAVGLNRAWNRGLSPEGDGRGNLVLIGSGADIVGTVTTPETGCYAVLRYSETSIYKEFGGIYADSALVLHRDREATTQDGRRAVTLYSDARRISLHPLRRIEGEACPGMPPVGSR